MKQAPQPLHLSCIMTGLRREPFSFGMTMAPSGQDSMHVLHRTLFRAIQFRLILARRSHGLSNPGSRNSPSEQFRAHAPQKLHDPLVKSIRGNPSSPKTSTPFSQCAIQSPQPLHSAWNASSSTDQGRGIREGETACSLSFSVPQFRKNSKHLLVKKEARFIDLRLALFYSRSNSPEYRQSSTYGEKVPTPTEDEGLYKILWQIPCHCQKTRMKFDKGGIGKQKAQMHIPQFCYQKVTVGLLRRY